MKQAYTLLLVLISVLASGQKQVTDFKMTEKMEDRFSSIAGEADGRIISISPNGTVWAYTPGDSRFDSIATIPNSYSAVLSDTRLYFYNNRSVWELSLNDRKVREIVDVPLYYEFEVKDGWVYLFFDQGPIRRYDVRDTSLFDIVTESRHQFIKTKNSLLIQEFPDGSNESKLLLTRGKKEFSTRIDTRRNLSIHAETQSGILLKEAVTGRFYLWDTEREKITRFETSDFAHFFEKENSTFCFVQVFANHYKSHDSLVIHKISPQGTVSRVSTDLGGYFWDEIMIAGVVLKPNMSNIVMKGDLAYFMSFGVLPGQGTGFQLILASVDAGNGDLKQWACSEEMTRDFLNSFTTFDRVYTLEVRNEELAVFPSNGGGKRFLFDTGKKTFQRSDLKANYHRDFSRVGNEDYYRADWDSLTIFNRPANAIKRVPRQNRTYASNIVNKHIVEEYVVMPYISESNTLTISIFNGTAQKSVEVYPDLPLPKNIVTRVSGTINKKYALFYFFVETFDNKYISQSFVLNLENAGLKRFSDDLLSGTDLASDHAVKYLYDSKILFENEKNVDLNTMEVGDFPIEYNHYLRHFTDSGYFIFSKNDSLKRFNAAEGSTKLLAVKSYFNLSAANGKFIFSEDNVLKVFHHSGTVQELMRVEKTIMSNSVTRLSENLIILPSKNSYALIDLLNDKVSYFQPGNTIDRMVYFNSIVYFTLSSEGLYALNTENMQIRFLGKRKIKEFIKSNNGLYLYACEQLPGNKWRYIRIDKETLRDLFIANNLFDPRITIFEGERDTEYFFLDIEAGRFLTIKSNDPLRNGYVVLNMDDFLILDNLRTKYGFSKKDGILSVLDIPETVDLEATRFGKRAYLVYKDSGIGTEIWQTDGTKEGTYLAYDINPGPDGSAPGKPFILKNNLFVFATTPQTGLQLWHLAHNDPDPEEEPEEEPEDILLSTENPALSFMVYPNPTAGHLTIRSRAESPAKYKITVFSTDGKVLSEQELALPQKLDLSGLETGVYLICIRSGNESRTFRVVRE